MYAYAATAWVLGGGQRLSDRAGVPSLTGLTAAQVVVVLLDIVALFLINSLVSFLVFLLASPAIE